MKHIISDLYRKNLFNFILFTTKPFKQRIRWLKTCNHLNSFIKYTVLFPEFRIHGVQKMVFVYEEIFGKMHHLSRVSKYWTGLVAKSIVNIWYICILKPYLFWLTKNRNENLFLPLAHSFAPLKPSMQWYCILNTKHKYKISHHPPFFYLWT
jgi:hypothetical protein